MKDFVRFVRFLHLIALIEKILTNKTKRDVKRRLEDCMEES